MIPVCVNNNNLLTRATYLYMASLYDIASDIYPPSNSQVCVTIGETLPIRYQIKVWLYLLFMIWVDRQYSVHDFCILSFIHHSQILRPEKANMRFSFPTPCGEIDDWCSCHCWSDIYILWFLSETINHYFSSTHPYVLTIWKMPAWRSSSILRSWVNYKVNVCKP